MTAPAGEAQMTVRAAAFLRVGSKVGAGIVALLGEAGAGVLEYVWSAILATATPSTPPGRWRPPVSSRWNMNPGPAHRLRAQSPEPTTATAAVAEPPDD